MLKWLVASALVCIFSSSLSGCSNNEASGKNSGVTSKTISFIEQVKDSQIHVWIKTKQEIGKQLSKDTIVETIFVLNNGKITAYQIQDNDITLGKVSKLDDKDTILLAKEQDKKYFEVSADEVKNFMNDKEQIGQQNDLWSDKKVQNILEGSSAIYWIGDISIEKGDFVDDDHLVASNVKIIDKQTYDNSEQSTEAKESGYLSSPVSISYLIAPLGNGTTFSNSFESKRILGNALLENIKKAEYKVPQAQKISHYKEKTDRTGNEIISQSFSYQAVDYFKSDSFEQNTYETFKGNQDMLKYIKFRFDSVSNNKWQNDEATRLAAKEQAAKVFSDNNLKTLTKGIFGYHKWTRQINLGTPTSQIIYNSSYVGYPVQREQEEAANGYLLTKAQDDEQQAILKNK